MRTLLPSLPLLGSLGCGFGLIDELEKVPVCDSQATDPECEDRFPTSTGGSGTTTNGAVHMTGDTGDTGVRTVTGDTTHDDGTTAAQTNTGAPVNAPPTIDLFAAEPAQLSEAGKALLELHASADVVAVRLYQNGAEIADLMPADFPYTYEAFSAKYNADPHTFRVEVVDAEGLTAAAELRLKVLLPAPGAERCHFKDQDMGAQSSAITGLVYAADAIVAVGWRDTGIGPQMTVWKLDKRSCEVLAGWPKALADWTASPPLAAHTSRAVGVEIDEAGYIAVAANLWPGGHAQFYAALLTPQGAPVWERSGNLGEEAAGIATGDGHRVFVVGSVRTSEDPVRTDGRIWGLNFEKSVLTIWASDLKAPFTADEDVFGDPKSLSERLHAVRVWNGEVFVIGEREFKADQEKPHIRTFVARYDASFGDAIDAAWTSPGDFFLHEAMNSLGLCGTSLIAGGWTRDAAPGSSPLPLMRWITPEGASVAGHSELLPATQTFGIACDREGKIVSGGTSGVGEFNTQVFASEGPQKPPIIYETGVAGDDAALTLACDPDEGFCASGGFRSPFAFLRVYNP